MIRTSYQPGKTRGEGRLSIYAVRKVAKAVTAAIGLTDSVTISVALVSQNEIQALNSRYRAKDKPTDVLSFTYEDPETYGEIVICPAVARKQAWEHGRSVREEMIYLLIHGFLHVFGYDHIKAKDAKIMLPLQETIYQNVI